MILFRRRAPSGPAAVDPGQFRAAMSRPAVARELFLPLHAAWWDRGRFTLGRWARYSPRPTVHGVRLHEARPGAVAPCPARDTQADLCTLVASVAELRRAPGLGGLVLSDETVVGRGGGAVPGRRVVFGLSSPPCGRFRPEDAAAAECHRVIRRAVDRAGYRVEHPAEAFDATTGFPGLLVWAGAVRLRRRRTEYRWFLLLPLLLVPLSCVSRWLPSSGPPDAEGAQSSLGKSGDAGKALSGGGASSGSGSSGGAGAGPKQGSGGNANAPGPSAPQGGGSRQGGGGAGKEEDGPPTTIPSKIAGPKGTGIGVGGKAPAFPWRNPGPGPWRVPGPPSSR